MAYPTRGYGSGATVPNGMIPSYMQEELEKAYKTEAAAEAAAGRPTRAIEERIESSRVAREAMDAMRAGRGVTDSSVHEASSIVRDWRALSYFNESGLGFAIYGPDSLSVRQIKLRVVPTRDGGAGIEGQVFNYMPSGEIAFGDALTRIIVNGRDVNKGSKPELDATLRALHEASLIGRLSTTLSGHTLVLAT